MVEKEDKMIILGVETDNKVFISKNNKEGSKWRYERLSEFIINGQEPEPTFKGGWYAIDKKPETLQKLVSQPNTNPRYELIDSSMESEKTPLVFKQEEVAEYIGYEWIWRDEFSMFRSLYKFVSDPQPSVLKDFPFEYKKLMEIKGDLDYSQQISFKVQKTKWEHEGHTNLTEEHVKHQIMDEILFPEIVLGSRPSSFTPEQSYKIIREHIKDNIDPKVAKITSDYDFCFTVQKRIPLSEPVKFTVDINNSIFSKRKRKPKYETRYRKERTEVQNPIKVVR